MLKKFLSNCKKPKGKFGKMIVSATNKGHAPLALWAFEVCPLKDGESVLDVGCGGCGNLVRILERCPKSRADGIEYSEESVACSRKATKKYADRCSILVSCAEMPCGFRIGMIHSTGRCPLSLFISGPIPCRGSKKCSAS